MAFAVPRASSAAVCSGSSLTIQPEANDGIDAAPVRANGRTAFAVAAARAALRTTIRRSSEPTCDLRESGPRLLRCLPRDVTGKGPDWHRTGDSRHPGKGNVTPP